MTDQGAHMPTGPIPGEGITKDRGHKSQQGSNFQQQVLFHTQLDSVTNNAHQFYNMSALAGALPAIVTHPSQQLHFDPESLYQTQHHLQYASRGIPVYFDPGAMRSPHSHQPAQHFYGPGYPPRVHSMPRSDMHHFGMNLPAHQAVHFSYGAQPGVVSPSSMTASGPHYGQRAPETAPVPSFPRGPPRKPKQSGHALWVGNLPPAATVVSLKDHFSRNARRDIESLFLISKSNCAFVNYRSEAACLSAKNRFHDSNFHGVRLVCRLRRGSTSVTPTAITPEIPQIPTSPAIESPPESAPLQNGGEPVIVGHLPGRDTTDPGSEIASSNASSTTPIKEPAKYFIVKSLTVEDLEASVQNGIWATQSHNEEALSNAFDQAENVFLIFSANKSGEYFGYARMTSQISGEPISLGKILENDEVGTPQSIPTLATATAPRGRIIDDSARGTIFWEAELSDEGEEDEGSPRKESAEGDDIQSSQNWGRQFKIVWMSTTRLPFFRTRGLRNPWNANREVKIARDGTELEPGIGLRLVQMFHRPIEAGLTAVAYS